MIATDFSEANGDLVGNHLTDHLGREVYDMRVHRTEHETISRWRLGWRERVSAFLFGNVWVRVIGHAVPPMALEARKTIFLKSSK